MPKSKKSKEYAGMTEEEWRNWGERFGKWMDQRGREFGEEMEDFGERFGKRMERRGKGLGRAYRSWWFSTFGFIGPLVGSIFGLICLIIGILVLNFFNIILQSSFISLLTGAVSRNMHLLFGAFLFFGYDDYFTKRYRKTYWVVKPITSSVGVIFVIWIAIWVLNTINISAKSGLIASVSNFLSINLWGIFTLLVVLGYALTVVKKIFFSYLWTLRD